MVFQRRYQKLFDLLATLGGILNPLIFLGNAFIKLIYRWKINEIIMNKIYALNLDDKKDNQKQDAAKKSKYNLKLTFFEKIMFLCKPREKFNQKEKIYSTYLEKSDEKLDLFKIIKKIEEIEKLKFLIMIKDN